ncbi:unnamed protein product [Parnassius mnemosyne]|uniref:Uncharacterized protein n=1 Tax=Parnassius mnemosyne TaxID=213953 RepID=A0AAV1L8Y7_9NEOP
MWKGLVVVHFIVVRNIISQPVIENEQVNRQTNFEECCPCPGTRDGDTNFRDQGTLSTMRSFARVPVDECPCRLTGVDSEASPSIFYPSFLRAAHPKERTEKPKEEAKPLLQPEVGLASSVLETLREATDEEYQDALERDAAKSAMRVDESDLFDSEPDNTRNSVTIVISSKDDLDNDDTLSEASHVQETRCIHSPLGNSNILGRQRVTSPRLSKEIVLPKHKSKSLLHKSLSDMDNSASNIQERINGNKNNDLSSKFKVNPSLLNDFSTISEEQIEDNSNTWQKSGASMQKILCESQNNLDSGQEFSNSPSFRLATLKNKLRDLTELRHAKRVHNNLHTVLKQNSLSDFNSGHGDSATDMTTSNFKLQSPLDTIFDYQHPIVKNLLKLKDVELIPPRKIFNKDSTKGKMYTGLKAARIENNDGIFITPSTINKNDRLMNTGECDNENASNLKENLGKVSDEITKIQSPMYTRLSNSPEIPLLTNQDSNEDSLNEKVISSDISEIADASDFVEEQGYVSKSNNENFEHKSSEDLYKENNRIEDSASETSDNTINILEKDINTQNDDSGVNDSSINDDIHHQDNNLKNTQDQNTASYPIKQETNRFESFKADILGRLENIKKNMKLNLHETNLKPPVKIEKSNNNQDVESGVNFQSKSVNDVTFHDLQKISNSLLNQENQQRVFKNSDCSNDDSISSTENSLLANNVVNDNQSDPSEVDYAKIQLDGNTFSSEVISDYDNDTIFNNSNSPTQQETHSSQSSEHICYVSSNENSFKTDEDKDHTDTHSEDFTSMDEMSLQASNSKYDAIRPQLNDDNLRSSLRQDIIVQPSFPTEGFNLFTEPFQIPSLDEIRQGITNIINAGQREVEEPRSSDFDPLTESSNLKSMLSSNLRSKLPKSSHFEDVDIDVYQLRPLQKMKSNPLIALPRLNINSFKTKLALPEPGILKPLKLESVLGNNAGILGATLSLGSDGTKSKEKSKSKLASDLLGISLREVPTLDDIRSLLQSNAQNIFKSPANKISKSNIMDRPLFSERSINDFTDNLKHSTDNALKAMQNNLKEVKLGNPLQNTRIDSNDFLESMGRKRDDMKEKLYAIHENLNDRLTSIHEKLSDQINLQSMNIPTYEDIGKSLSLPTRISFEKDNDYKKLVSTRLPDRERNLQSTSSLSSQDEMFVRNKMKPLNKSHAFNARSKNDDKRTFKQNLGIIGKTPSKGMNKASTLHQENYFSDLKNFGKHSGLAPLKNNKVKIKFSTTTLKPIIKHKYYKKTAVGYPTKYSLESLRNDKNAALKTKNAKIKSIEDVHRSPSELTASRIRPLDRFPGENKGTKNSQQVLDINTPLKKSLNVNNALSEFTNDKHKTNQEPSVLSDFPVSNQALAQQPFLPKTKENSFISNVREAIRTRLANITPISKTLPLSEDKLKSNLDTIESPSENVKAISIMDNPLKENTSYKCTMMCVKDL